MKNCPYCKSSVKMTGDDIDHFGRKQSPMVIFHCGTSVRSGCGKAIAGRGCKAYVSAYPLPPHLEAIHLSESKKDLT